MSLQSLFARVLLRVCGPLFRRKYALVDRAGLSNEAGFIALGSPLRELYDFAHLNSQEETSGESGDANTVPDRSIPEAGAPGTCAGRL
jgi:hypothetical protein